MVEAMPPARSKAKTAARGTKPAGRRGVKVIEESAVLAAALEIVDKEGVAALNIRRLGDELGVHGASLYHYFDGKDDILLGVQRLAMARLRVDRIANQSWQDWLVAMSSAFRDALLRHPNVAPLMLHSQSRKLLGAELRDAAARNLIAGGVPEHFVVPITESFETMAFGSAMIDPSQQDLIHAVDGSDADYPNLAEAMRANAQRPGERFDAAVRALVAGWEALIRDAPPSPPAG